MRFVVLGALALLACSRSGGPSFSSSPDAMRAWAQAALREKLPQWKIEGDSDPLVLNLDHGDQHLEVFLGRPFEYCRSNVRDCERMAREYLDAVVQTATEATKKAQPEQLLPAVRSRADVESYRARAEGLLEEPIAGDLYVVYMIDSPKSASVVDRKTVAELGLTSEQIQARALKNLEDKLPEVSTLVRPENAQLVRQVKLDDYYTSSLLVPHSAWTDVAKSFDGKLLVAVPAPDVLLYAREDSPATVRSLSDQARQVFQRSPKGTSTVVLRWTAQGWKVAPGL